MDFDIIGSNIKEFPLTVVKPEPHNNSSDHTALWRFGHDERNTLRITIQNIYTCTPNAEIYFNTLNTHELQANSTVI